MKKSFPSSPATARLNGRAPLLDINALDTDMHDKEFGNSIRNALSNAIAYWERGRIVYNGALVLVVVISFIVGLPVSFRLIGTEWVIILFVLAVLANVVYCAAYIPDIAFQYSSFRPLWLKYRWVLLVVGTLFGGALSYLFVAGPFGLTDGNW